AEAGPGNKNTVIKAPGYYETGSFYPTAFPGRTVTRTVYLHPSAGRVVVSVRDAVTGEPLKELHAYLLDNGWARYEDGRAEAEAGPGNKNTVIKAPGYYETGSFYPTAFPGRTVARTVFLMPSSGRFEFSVRDAITGEPLKAFQAYLLDNGWAGYRDGKAVTEAEPGNKNTVIRAQGYNETGSFFPSAFPGHTVTGTVFLQPSEGRVSFKIADAITENPIPSFWAYLIDNGWAWYEGMTVSSASGAGNKNTVIRADGFYEENFYPGVFPGRTAEYSVFLNPKEPEGRLNVKCVDLVTGERVANAVLYPSGEGELPAPDGTASHTSHAHFKHQWLRASAPGYKDAEGPAYFASGRRDISFVIPMERVMPKGRGELLATVTDADGNPVPGASAALSCQGDVAKGRTNKSGQIFFRNVPSGVHTLSASARGYSGGSARVAIGGRETARTGLSLEPLSSGGRRAPFDVEIVSAPSGETIRPGEKKTLYVLLNNRGGEGGRAYCSLELPDAGKMVKEVILEAGERAEVPFEVTMPEDSVNSQIPVVARVGEKSKKGLLTVRAPAFTVAARTDKEAYLEGENIEVEVEVTSDGASGEYQVRVGFNEESRVENIKLEGGKGRAVFSGIPAAFRGNRLLYGLYHTTGRSVLLNALPVRDRSAAVLMIPDRQQYNAGETVKLKIIGKGGDVFSVSSPLIPGKSAGEEGVIEALANTEGIAFIEAALPAGLATGVYPFRCGGYSAEVDVRGLEARILDRRLEEDVGSGELRLHWSMESSAEIPCKWTVEAIPQDDEPYEAASGDIKLKNGAGEYWIPVEPYDDEPCDLLLKLEPASGGEPLAAVRYSWAGLEE
ncbi:MAG: carboxypeptidase regulatory-like domain-containing protein, partial [Synergistaceae bacterium]|nr:carboxypeptidase regulatory-like domain-containing protein [Synergistaceae bacterium]